MCGSCMALPSVGCCDSRFLCSALSFLSCSSLASTSFLALSSSIFCLRLSLASCCLSSSSLSFFHWPISCPSLRLTISLSFSFYQQSHVYSHHYIVIVLTSFASASFLCLSCCFFSSRLEYVSVDIINFCAFIFFFLPFKLFFLPTGVSLLIFFEGLGLGSINRSSGYIRRSCSLWIKFLNVNFKKL